MKHYYFLFRRAYPIDLYAAQCKEAAAIMMMIMNNLDPQVAQFPEELITYGGNGQVFSNWAQVTYIFFFSFAYYNVTRSINQESTQIFCFGSPI